MTTTTHTNGRIEMSIPRIPGVRSCMVAYVDSNCGSYMVTKVRRDVDGEESVLHYKNCRTYSTQARAIKAAEKFLSDELARAN